MLGAAAFLIAEFLKISYLDVLLMAVIPTGLFYLALWLYGSLSERPREILPLNGADNWLHLGVGGVMVVLGLTLAASRVPTGADGEVLIPE